MLAGGRPVGDERAAGPSRPFVDRLGVVGGTARRRRAVRARPAVQPGRIHAGRASRRSSAAVRRREVPAQHRARSPSPAARSAPAPHRPVRRHPAAVRHRRRLRSPSLPPPSSHPRRPTTSARDPSHAEPCRADRDPPLRAYARIECDDSLVAATPFELTVGLSPIPVSGVVGPALIRPPTSVGDYELTVHVVADGFELAPGESWRKTMLVTAAEAYPYVVFNLVAPHLLIRAGPRDQRALLGRQPDNGARYRPCGSSAASPNSTLPTRRRCRPRPVHSAYPSATSPLISRSASCTATKPAGCCGRSSRPT